MAGLLPTILVCAVSLTGCPTTHTTSQLPNGLNGTPTASQLGTELAAIGAQLDAGLTAEAAAAIEALASTHTDAATLGALEVMRGRLALERVDLDGAEAAFARAAASSDAAAASAGRLYVALLATREGELDAAIAPLVVHFDEPNDLAAPRDLPTLWLLAAEASAAAGDPLRGIEHLGRSFDEAEAQADEALAPFVAARAFELAALLEPGVAEASWSATRGLARAALGDRLVREHFAAGATAEAEAALLEASAALAMVGELGRLSELEHLVKLDGSAGGGRALIGVVLPLTGESRRVGRRMLAGILQAQGTFFPGGGRRLTVVFKDSGSDPARAVEAVEALDALGALAIIGPIDAVAARAAAETATQRGLPLISLALDDDAVDAGGLHFGVDVEAELALLAEHLVAAGRLRAVAVRPETAFGRAMTERFGALLAERGGELVETWSYEPGQSDLRRIAKDAVRESFDVVFVPDTARSASVVASFFAEQNLWGAPLDAEQPGARDGRRFVTFAGPSTWYDDAELGESERRYLDGALFPVTWASERPGDQNALFVETFEMLYERSPGLYEALAYDVTRMLRELVMNRGVAERAALRTALEAVEGREGVTGTFGFVDGDATPAPMLLELRATEGLRPAPPLAIVAPPTEPPPAPLPAGTDSDGSDLPPAVLEP